MFEKGLPYWELFIKFSISYLGSPTTLTWHAIPMWPTNLQISHVGMMGATSLRLKLSIFWYKASTLELM